MLGIESELTGSFNVGRLYTIRDVADTCNVAMPQVQRWIAKGFVPASRIANVYVMTGEDVRKALIRHLRGEIRLPLSVGRELRVPDDIRQEAL